MLGQHPEMIGLGGIDEVMQWIVRAPGEVAGQLCSCGGRVGECPYWKEVLDAAQVLRPRSVAERYRVALDVFTRVFGPDIWPVDATQIHEPLAELAREPDLDVRVLSLTRDFRSAIVSIVDLKLRRKCLRRPRFLLAMEAAFRWKRENGRIATAVRATGLPRLAVGYEEFCLSLVPSFARICAFLDIAPFVPTREVHAGHNHSFVGNDMRKQPSKVRVCYDYRWMTRSDWWLPGLLVPGLRRRNLEWVYANGGDEIFGSCVPLVKRREDVSKPSEFHYLADAPVAVGMAGADEDLQATGRGVGEHVEHAGLPGGVRVDEHVVEDQ